MVAQARLPVRKIREVLRLKADDATHFFSGANHHPNRLTQANSSYDCVGVETCPACSAASTVGEGFSLATHQS